MRASSLSKYRDLKELADQIPDLVNMIRDKNKTFVLSFEKWLLKSEELLKKYNYSECSEIAGLRSRIYVVEFEEEKRLTRKKRQMQIGSEMIYTAQNIIFIIVQNLEDKVNEATETAVELIQIAKENGIIKNETTIDFNGYISSLWQYFNEHEQLNSYAKRINSLVGRTDALRLMAENIN